MSVINVLLFNKGEHDLCKITTYLNNFDEELNITKSESIDDSLKLLDEKNFDAVVSINKNPNLSSLLKKLRRDKATDIPFIIYSNKKYAEVAVDALNLGADAYIVKNEKNEDLKKLTETLIDKAEEYKVKQNDKNILKIKEDDFRTFLDSINDWVWEMDKEGIHTYSNSAVKDILGYDIDEVVGYSAWKLWPDEDKKKTDKKDFKENLRRGKKWENFVGKFKHKDGTKKFLESTGIPIYNENDNLLGYRGIDRDITERRRAQKRERFLHSLLRHDIKNKIQVTKGYLHLMKDFDMKDKVEEYLKKANESLNDEENLIDKISYLRKIDEKDEIVDVNLKKYIDKSIENNISMLEESDVEIKTNGVDLKVKGGELIEEMFTNLIENSLKHSDCQKIIITGEKNLDGVFVVYEDDGKGISEDNKDNIFEKKIKGEESIGSGLGLYLVKRIVNTYGGDIKVKDSDIGGARFDIYLNS